MSLEIFFLGWGATAAFFVFSTYIVLRQKRITTKAGNALLYLLFFKKKVFAIGARSVSVSSYLSGVFVRPSDETGGRGAADIKME